MGVFSCLVFVLRVQSNNIFSVYPALLYQFVLSIILMLGARQFTRSFTYAIGGAIGQSFNGIGERAHLLRGGRVGSLRWHATTHRRGAIISCINEGLEQDFFGDNSSYLGGYYGQVNGDLSSLN